MKLNSLKLKNFRNHKNKTIDFYGKSFLIVGPNGSGKTNLLEAIHLLATTKSLRASYDREMIAHDKGFTNVIGSVSYSDGDEKKLELAIVKSERSKNTSKKQVKINKVKKSLNNFAGTINTTLFTPHDVELFTQSPSIRRKYLDQIFFQTDKDYKKAHSKFTKAVRHRNKLLERIRDFGQGKTQLDFWNEKILESGQLIQEKRQEYFDFVNEKINEYAHKLDINNAEYKIEYNKNTISEKRLSDKESIEIAAARTLIGPNRDDFEILYNGHNVGSFGSRGQKRTVVLALKLCEIDFLEEKLERRPILLLDDIFSELDMQHKEAVSNIIDKQQTIITTADRDDLDKVKDLDTLYL